MTLNLTSSWLSAPAPDNDELLCLEQPGYEAQDPVLLVLHPKLHLLSIILAPPTNLNMELDPQDLGLLFSFLYQLGNWKNAFKGRNDQMLLWWLCYWYESFDCFQFKWLFLKKLLSLNATGLLYFQIFFVEVEQETQRSEVEEKDLVIIVRRTRVAEVYVSGHEIGTH